MTYYQLTQIFYCCGAVLTVTATVVLCAFAYYLIKDFF